MLYLKFNQSMLISVLLHLTLNRFKLNVVRLIVEATFLQTHYVFGTIHCKHTQTHIIPSDLCTFY